MAILPAVNGIEQRLDRLQVTIEALLDELRAFAPRAAPAQPASPLVKLSEPAKRGRPRRSA